MLENERQMVTLLARAPRLTSAKSFVNSLSALVADVEKESTVLRDLEFLYAAMHAGTWRRAGGHFGAVPGLSQLLAPTGKPALMLTGPLEARSIVSMTFAKATFGRPCTASARDARGDVLAREVVGDHARPAAGPDGLEADSVPVASLRLTGQWGAASCLL